MASKLSGNFEITGIAETNAALKALPLKLAKNALRGATFAVAKELAVDVAQTAPRKTGFLKSNIKAQRGRSRDFDGVFFSNIKGVFYARFLEKGTKFMSAKAFIGPAIERNMEKITKDFARLLDVAIGKQYKKLSKMASK